MADAGVIETDELLSELEAKILDIYSRSIDSLQEELKNTMEKFQKEDEKQHQRWIKGEITQADYVDWRQKALMRGKHYEDMISVLTEDITNSDKLAISAVREHMPEVYAINANYGTYEIESGSGINTSWTLYDRQTVENLIKNNPELLPMPELDIPKDKAWNMKHLNNCITQGILKGDSIPKIAQQLSSVVGMGRNAAIRNARTATTCAQNAGRVSSYKRAEALGIDLKQQWLATLDSRTRHEHRLLDGQIVKVGDKFKVGSEEIEYPGDPRASDPSLIYNCRCTLVAVVSGHDQSNAPRDSKLGSMSYDEWKHELENKHESSKIDAYEEAKNTNPKYESGKYEYTHNCQRCVPAWEYRMRGYDVEACGCPPYGDFDALASSPFSVWDFSIFSKDENVKAHMDKEGNGKDKIIEFLLRCGNGARVQICVDWEFVQEGHVFSAQNENGKIVFYDPQSGDRGTIVEDYFDRVKIGKTAWLRIDNKEIRQQKKKDVMRDVN